MCISTQHWPDPLNSHHGINQRATYTSQLLHVTHADVWWRYLQFKVETQLKTSLLKPFISSHGTLTIRAKHLLPSALVFVFPASKLKATLVDEITFFFFFARWKSLGKPFEYANFGKIKSCWWEEGAAGVIFSLQLRVFTTGIQTFSEKLAWHHHQWEFCQYSVVANVVCKLTGIFVKYYTWNGEHEDDALAIVQAAVMRLHKGAANTAVWLIFK